MTTRRTVLVVDDEAAMREVLEMRLDEWGFDVELAADGAQAAQQVEECAPDLVISDVVLPDLTGLDLLRTLKAGDPARPVLLITAYGSVDAAVEAMKEGALDFLTKPLDYGKLRAVLDGARDELDQRGVARDLAGRLDTGAGGMGELVGASRAMRRLYELVNVLAGSDAAAILTGESGTGKEVVARTLHRLSPRKDGPFVAVNSAALPDGLTESELFGHEKGAFTGAIAARPGCFEQADGGTLFLDEIAEMPISLQPKLLRLLEEGTVKRLGGTQEIAFDVRVIAATNREPEAAVDAGLLRQDLFFRLNVFHVELPALRTREGDVPLLVQHFVARFNDKHRLSVEGLSSSALELMTAYSWPGNVRELRNVVERGVILAKEGFIQEAHLPPYVVRPGGGARTQIVLPARVTAAEAERILIEETLERVSGNKAEAARQLGLDVKTIRNKLKAWR